MRKYTNVDSNYIKKTIENLPWEQHEYIDDLIRIHRFIRKSPQGWAANMGFHLLKEKYLNDYLELLKENSIERYNQELERIKREEEELRKYKEETKKEEEELKQDWLKSGGEI